MVKELWKKSWTWKFKSYIKMFRIQGLDRPALQVERISIFLLFPAVTSDWKLYGGFLSKSTKRFLYTVELTSFSKAEEALAMTKAKCFGNFSIFPEYKVKYKNCATTKYYLTYQSLCLVCHAHSQHLGC